MTRYRALRFFTRCVALEPGAGAARASLEREIRAGQVPWELVVEVASQHYMIGALAVALRDAGLRAALPEEAAAYFDEMRELCADRSRRIREQMVEIARALNAIGVEPIFFKGAGHLIDGLYPDAACRLMDDIDILIPEGRMDASFDRLAADGYEFHREAGAAPRPYDPTEAIKRAGRPAFVELHRRAVDHAGEPVQTSAQILARSRRLAIEGAALRVPGTTDAAIIAILHSYVYHQAHLQGTVMFRDMYDLMLLDRRTAGRPDWDEVRRRFIAAGYGTLLRRCVTMAERVYGQPSPATTAVRRAGAGDWWRYRFHLRYPWTFRCTYFLAPRIDQLARMALEAFSSSPRATELRRKFISPSFYGRMWRSVPKLMGKSPWR
jgi:putative nucleotidyltransferase-like protein